MNHIRVRIGVFRDDLESIAATLTFNPGLTSSQLMYVRQIAENLPDTSLTVQDNRNALVIIGANTEEEAKFALIDFFDSICEVLQYKMQIVPR